MSYDEHLISQAGGDGDVLDQIQRRADAAGEGPWTIHAYHGTRCLAEDPDGALVVDYSTWTADGHEAAAKAEDLTEFIAHARTDVPYLLALVREQAAKLDAVRELANDASSQPGSELAPVKAIGGLIRAALGSKP